MVNDFNELSLAKMQCVVAIVVLLILSIQKIQCLSFNPDDYLEVYPDPRDSRVLQGRTPLYFALIQSLGGEFSLFDGSGSVAGVKVALDRINNDSSLLPGYTLHYTLTNSQCNRTESLIALYSQIFLEPTKLAVIGGGCSVATEPTAEVSHFYNITQLSCVSSSPELSNRIRFPSYFQLLSTAERIAFGYYGMIRAFGWRRVGLIVQDENLFTVPIMVLKNLLRAADLDYNETVFSSGDGIAGLGPNPFDEDSRIFVLSMFSSFARPLLCEAYHREIVLPKFVFITIGWFRRFWWRVEELGDTCTADERESVLASTLAAIDDVLLDETTDGNLTTTPGITGAEFLAEESIFLDQPPLNLTFYEYSQYCHDATWSLAYALNKTLQSLGDGATNEDIVHTFNTTSPFRLEDFTYRNHKLQEIIFRHLESTSFDGITGHVDFGPDGVRNLDKVILYQYRYRRNDNSTFLERVRIGSVSSPDNNFSFLNGENNDTVWNGTVLYDGVPEEVIVTIHPAITSIYVVLSCAGMLLAIACLIFNFLYRQSKLVKLASAKLNYLIGIGAIVLYLDVIIFVIPTTDPEEVRVLCNSTPWLTAIGYSLCYGTILTKMARVSYLFNNPIARKKAINDKILLLGVASLVAMDLLILITYYVVEGTIGNLTVELVEQGENPQMMEGGELGVITNNFVYICDSEARDTFLGILYGYKMVLQFIALLFAFSIRKVQVKGLNDATYIAASIYVTSIVLAVIIVATYSLKDFILVFTTLFCIGFVVGTTVILILVFAPLMVGIYKDPNGETIFKTTSNTGAHAVTKESDSGEVQTLRKRIKQLEDENRELIAAKDEQKTKKRTRSILRSLEASNMVEPGVVEETSFDGTIWDHSDKTEQQPDSDE